MQAYHRECRAALPHFLRLRSLIFIRLRRVWFRLVGLPFAFLIFIYSPAACMVKIYSKRQPTGSGGVCNPAIPPPRKCAAFKRLTLCPCGRVIRRVPTHYAGVKNALMPALNTCRV